MRFERILAIVFLIAVAVLLMPWIHGNDGAGYYAPARSIVVDGDLDLQNEYEFFVQDRPLAAIRPDPKTGKYYSQYPIGVSLIWLPAVYVAHGISLVAGWPATGYTTLYYWFVCFWSALLAFGALLRLFRFLNRTFDRTTSFWAVFTGWTATNLFYYMFFEASISHAVSFALMTLFFLQAYKLHSQPKGNLILEWFKMGLLMGGVFLIRYQDGIVWLVPGMVALGQYISAFRQKAMPRVRSLVVAHVVTALALVLTILPDLWINRMHHGKWWVSGPEYYHGTFVASQWWYGLKVLFSAHHGLVFWTPITLLAILGLFLNPKRAERPVLLMTLLLHIVVTGFWSFWHGAQSYSHRFFVGYVPLFIYGLALLQKAIPEPWLRGLRPLFGLLILLNLALMAQYGLRMIPSEGPLDIGQFVQNLREVPGILSGVLEYIRSKVVPE